VTTEFTPSRAAARSLSAIAFNQIPQIVGSVLYVLLIPRTLGAEVFGQLAYALAFIVLFQMLGELGYQEIFSRHLPEVRQRAGEPGIRALARHLLGVKALVGLGLGLAAALVARGLAPWLRLEQIGLMGLSVAARIVALAAFPLLLGLGETLKWSVDTTWRQLTVTLLMFAIVRTPSLTLSLLALAVHELVFLLLGLWWTRQWVMGDHEARPATSLDLGFGIWELLRFGFVFSLANFTLVMMFRISPIVVEKLTGSYPEVGFFDLALGGLLLLYTFLGQVAYAFVPILTELRLEQRPAEAEVWLGRFVRYATLIVGLGAGGMWAVARPAAPLLFGAGFEPAANTLRAIAVGLLPLPIAWAGVTVSAVDKQPKRKVRGALLGLGVFLVGAVVLRTYAAAGIAFAFGLALIAYSAGYGRIAWRAVIAGGRGWLIALATTAFFLIFFYLSFSSLWLAFAVWVGVAVVYLLVNFAFRVARLDELKEMARALRR